MPSSSRPLSTEFEAQLMEYGTKLLDPPSSVDELLKLLDIVEQLLITVDQTPPCSMQDALLPCMMGLIGSNILKHTNMDVKVSVAFCMSEITRITAPDPPYNDAQMKEIFRLTLETFDNLLHASDWCYKKTISILVTMSRVKSYSIMLDLKLDDLIIQMFKQFFEIIGTCHSSIEFTAMKTIMTDTIDQSDDISLGLLTPLLASVKKENQNVSPHSWKLGEKVISSCAAKLKPYLLEAMKSLGTALDDYAQIVANTFRNRLGTPIQNNICISREHLLEPEPSNNFPRDSAQLLHGAGGALLDCSDISANENSLKEVEDSERFKVLEEKEVVENKNVKPKEGIKLEITPKSVPKKRGRKTNSLGRPEDGYDHSLIVAEKKGDKISHKRKSTDTESLNLVIGLPALPSKRTKITNNLESPDENSKREGTSASADQLVSCGSRWKRGRQKRTGNMMHQDDRNSVSSSGKFALDADVKEEFPDASDVDLENEVKDISDLEEKPRGPIRHSSKTGKESIAQGDLASEEGADGSSDHEKKLLLKLFSKDTGAINSCEDHTETLRSQRIKATKSAKSTPKRKCSDGDKEKAYKMGDLDGRLVGKRIDVWWPLDKTFYEGVIESFDQKKKRHKILYTDGVVETLNLYKKRWKLILDDASPDEEWNGIPVVSPLPISSCNVPKRRKKPKLADEDMVASSSRRSEVSRTKEVEARNSGYRSLTECRIDHSNVDITEIGTSGSSEMLDDGSARSCSVKPRGDNKLRGDGANFGHFEKIKDDVNPVGELSEQELINSREYSMEKKASNSGGEILSNFRVKVNAGRPIGTIDELQEETLGNAEQTTS